MIASVTYNTSGSAGPYTITFPFIEDTDVEVYLDGVANTAFTIAGTALTLNTAPSATEIEIRRNTQDDLYVDFSAPAPISPEDLDTATQQAIYIAQEAKDSIDAVQDNVDAEAVTRAAADVVLQDNIDVVSDALAAAQIEAGNVPTPAGGDAGKFLEATGANTYAWATVDSADIADATTTGKAILTAATAEDVRVQIQAAKHMHIHPQRYGFVPVLPASAVLPNPILNQVFGG